jgi:hypothetical protein
MIKEMDKGYARVEVDTGEKYEQIKERRAKTMKQRELENKIIELEKKIEEMEGK